MSIRNKLLATAGLCCVVAGLFSGCGQPANEAWPAGKSPRLLVTFAPLYSLVANVAGEHAAVQTLMTTTGPHEYQPTPHDTLKLRQADLFFINGLELDEAVA